MKQLMGVEVMGKTGPYIFHFKGDPSHVEEWRAGCELNPECQAMQARRTSQHGLMLEAA